MNTEKKINSTSKWAFGYLIIALAAIILLVCDCGETINAFVAGKKFALFMLWLIAGIYFIFATTYYPRKYRKILRLTGKITKKDTRRDISDSGWLPMIMIFIALFDYVWLAAIGAAISLALNELTKTSSLHYYNTEEISENAENETE